MNENERLGLRWYEPGQCFTWFNGSDYLDKNSMVLVHPEDYSYCDGFFII